MKRIVLAALTILMLQTTQAQFVATMEIKDSDSITNLCNRKGVYALFPMFKGQEQAVCAETKEDIQKRLNEEVKFLKDNPSHEDKGMVNIIINCKGEVVRCAIDNKTKSPELDEQIVAVFKTLNSWQPGKLNKKKVDSSRLWSFEIKEGKISLN